MVHHGYRGRLRFRELAVLGDFESVDFQIDSLDGSRVVTIERQSRLLNESGSVISLFEIEGSLAEWVRLPWNWSADVASPLLFSDLLYLGPEGHHHPIYLPLMVLPKTLPRSRVVRASPRLQYASNVINVAVPDLHQAQLEDPGSLGFSPQEIIELVEEELGGDYDEFGFGLWQHHLTNPGAYHQNTSPGFPSHSVYSSAAIPVFELWKHEIAHNWNFRYDLPRLVGWQAPFDGAHSRGTVAEEPGVLCCGSYPIRRVAGKWRTVWIRDPHPFHPLELLAMGLIDPEDVPDMVVFKRQNLRDYLPDEPMRGPTRRLTIDEVVAAYGVPTTPRRGTWNVAPVIVSRKLLKRKDLSKLNYYLRRIGDPDGTVPQSFDRSTGGLMDLSTEITALDRPQPRPPLGIVFPSIGTKEIPGVVLDTALPGCLRPGARLTVSGRTATGVLPEIALAPSNPALVPIEAQVERRASGFRAEFAPVTEDVYQLVLGPVWPPDEVERPPSGPFADRQAQVTVGPIYVMPECPTD